MKLFQRNQNKKSALRFHIVMLIFIMLNYSLATVVALPVIKVGLNINLGNSEFEPDKLNYSLFKLYKSFLSSL